MKSSDLKTFEGEFIMKLYYSSGSCSMSCHIGLEEAGLAHTAIQIDFDKQTKDLDEALKLNPLGVVPVIVTDQGKTLTQNAAILEFIADAKPSSHLLAASGTFERAETMAWLSFVASDLHKSFGPLFQIQAVTANEAGQKDVRTWAETNVKKYLAHVDQNLTGRDYICGKQFTVADAYLYTVVGWCKYVNIKTDEFKNLNAYMNRVTERPAVQRVLKAEGLLN
jgi:glutathione S-transferase